MIWRSLRKYALLLVKHIHNMYINSFKNVWRNDLFEMTDSIDDLKQRIQEEVIEIFR
jgi:hypothetical protein